MTIDIPYVEILSLTDHLGIKSLHLASFLLHCKTVGIKEIVCPSKELPLFVMKSGEVEANVKDMSEMSNLGRHLMYHYMQTDVEYQVNLMNLYDDYCVTTFWTGGVVVDGVCTQTPPVKYTLKQFIATRK